MEKECKIYVIISIICISIVILFCGFLILKNNDKKITDALRFKMEYEALNDKKDATETTYITVEIPDDNQVVYKNPKEIVEILKAEKAIVYFGFPSNFVCRSIIETLLQVAKDKEINKIYYVNIENIRDEFIYDNSLIPKETKKGTEAYYDILEFFGENLEKYYVKDQNGNGFATGERRLGAPTIVAIKDGEIKDIFNPEEDREYLPVDEKQKEEIYNTFVKLVESIHD